jgi:RNA polymerase sigma factor (sigma-70 family)
MPPTTPELARWFAEEVQPHEASLRAYLRVSAPTPSDVDDLVQESFIRLLRMHEGNSVRCPKALLFAIARNAIRDTYRRARTDREIPLTESNVHDILDQAADVIDLVNRRQEQVLLAEALKDLPERCREIIILRKIHGLSQKEIAGKLNISINTVESAISRGLRRCATRIRKVLPNRQ